MSFRASLRLCVLLASCVAGAAPAPGTLSFEDAVRMSDRIIVGTVQTAGAGLVRLGDANDIVLGIKEPISGLVFTPYRVRIVLCLFDKDDSCTPGDSEVLIPGGTVYETVDGQQRLRTWEVPGAASAPLPAPGGDVLLFMSKRNGRYVPLNDNGARIRVDHSSGTASVELRFASPRFLSDEGRESARARLAAGAPATTPPVFTDSVEIERLKAMIELTRQVLKPTSGIGHAFPDRAHAHGDRDVRQRRPCVCTG